jgi:hypothetical protein
MEDGTQTDADPKSEAGKRLISLSAGLRGDIEAHLKYFAQAGPDGRPWVSVSM